MSAAVANQAWPEDKLEQLGRCPVCGSGQRKLLFDRLIDNTFRVAAGFWTLWRCESCTNAHLDPRPDRASIGEAYKSYYTHHAPAPSVSASRLASFRQALGNAYRNKRFGLALTPSIMVGSILARLLPRARKRIDIEYRFIPGPGRNRCSILDIGCGNGSWLDLARQSGWVVHGVEPDAVSAQRAKDLGIDVRADLGEFLREGTRFEHITMSHVIEHVHDPVKTLKSCYALLAPGGLLYIQTPNVGALGLKIYGRNWRGLEAPRHLVLFSLAGLKKLLRDLGYDRIAVHSLSDDRLPIAIASERMKLGLLPDDNSAPIQLRRLPITDRIRGRFDRSGMEFITLTCRRPC